MRRTVTTVAMLALLAGSAFAETPAPKAPAAGQPAPAQPAAPKPPAPVAADPSTTTAAFGDWLLRCIRATPEAPRFCEVIQTIEVEGRGTIAQLAVGRVEAKAPLKVTLVLPNNIAFATRPSLALADKDAKPLDLTWQRCLPGGCFADAALADPIVATWRGAAENGQIRFADGAGRAVALPFSFRGLPQALDAFAKN